MSKKPSKKELEVEYLPYVVEIKEDNTFYIMNRKYEYIKLNVKSIENHGTKTYLFNDGNNPFCGKLDSKINKNNLKEIIKKYHELTDGKICLNMDNNSSSILKLDNNNFCQKCGEKKEYATNDVWLCPDIGDQYHFI